LRPSYANHHAKLRSDGTIPSEPLRPVSQTSLRKKFFEARFWQIEEAERRQVHPPHASGVRRALKRSALACRRSTAVLAAASERHSSAPATRFLGLVGAHDPDGSKDRALFNGRYPLLPVPVQRVSSQTGHHAGRAY